MMMISVIYIIPTPVCHILFISGLKLERRLEWRRRAAHRLRFRAKMFWFHDFKKCFNSSTLFPPRQICQSLKYKRDYSRAALSLPVLSPPAQCGGTRGTLIKPQQTQLEKSADFVQPPHLHMRKIEAQRGCGFV